MTKVASKRRLVAFLGIVAVLVAGQQLIRRSGTETVRTVEGRITRIDLNTRTAAIELIHKKTGQAIEVSSQVPLHCDIRIDGQPAELADLRVGQRVQVQARLHADRTITVEWVRAEGRPPASAPATGPSDLPP